MEKSWNAESALGAAECILLNTVHSYEYRVELNSAYTHTAVDCSIRVGGSKTNNHELD